MTNAPNSSARCSSRSRTPGTSDATLSRLRRSVASNARCRPPSRSFVAATSALSVPASSCSASARMRWSRPSPPSLSAAVARLNGRSTVRCGSGFSVSGSLRASGSLSIGGRLTACFEPVFPRWAWSTPETMLFGRSPVNSRTCPSADLGREELPNRNRLLGLHYLAQPFASTITPQPPASAPPRPDRPGGVPPRTRASPGGRPRSGWRHRGW